MRNAVCNAMPVLIRASGKIRVFVYPGDHQPTHVHVKDTQYEVKVDIYR